MSRNSNEQTKRLYSPEYPFTPLSQTSTTTIGQQQASMMTFDQRGIDGMRLAGTTLTSSQSSASIGSRTAEEKAEDELFDKIEDHLGSLMHDPPSHHLPCRVFQWPFPGDPSRVVNAVIVISPATPRN